MRIDHSNSTTIQDICIDHIFKKGWFSHSGLSDDIYMSSSIDRLDSKPFGISTKVRYSDRRIGTFHIWEIVRNLELSTHDPVHSWGFYIECRKMNNPCKFSCIKDWSTLSDMSRYVDISFFLCFLNLKIVPLWICVDIKTSSYFIQDKGITHRFSSIF